MALKVGELFATIELRDAPFNLALSRARAGLAGLSAAARKSGLNFSRGLAAGITAGESAITRAARQAAQAAVNAANERLQIHSPSRVMRQSGARFSEGFALGIRSGEPASARAARELAAAAARAVPAMDYERLASAMEQRPLVIEMDGRQILRILAPGSRRLDAADARSASLALGKYAPRR